MFVALIHKAIRRNGHDEDVAEAAGLFEVPNVPDVQQVEYAVAVHDRLLVVARSLEDFG